MLDGIETLGVNFFIERNSVNPTHKGPDRCRIIDFATLSDANSTALSYCYRYFFLGSCSYTLVAQLITAVFHWISPSPATLGSSAFFSVFSGVCIGWSRRQGVRRYHNGWNTDYLRGSSNVPLRLFFPVKNKTLVLGLLYSNARLSGFLDYQMSDERNFRSTWIVDLLYLTAKNLGVISL